VDVVLVEFSKLPLTIRLVALAETGKTVNATSASNIFRMRISP
jgi:hypothetical protein